jgi:dUTP pyrophosphatase
MQRRLIPTGLAISLPDGYEAQIRTRSGMALKHGITVANSPGTIDSDYRGEVQIVLNNYSEHDFTVTRGMRIAQMVIAPFAKAVWENVDALGETGRGDRCFGSTGGMGQ